MRHGVEVEVKGQPQWSVSSLCLPTWLRQGLLSVVHSVSFQSFVTEGLPSSCGSAGITNDAD